MRIISGTGKGRVLRAPSVKGVRPTTDFAKTGLFNMLRHRVALDRIDVLDLFCGTGNISFEFLSRGALAVTAVDNHPSCIRYVRKTAGELGFHALTAVRSDVFRFLRAASASWDVVFADPPYDFRSYDRLVGDMTGVMRPGGWAVIEHARKTHFDEHATFVFQRAYGQSAFSFFQGPTGT